MWSEGLDMIEKHRDTADLPQESASWDGLMQVYGLFCQNSCVWSNKAALSSFSESICLNRLHNRAVDHY